MVLRLLCVALALVWLPLGLGLPARAAEPLRNFDLPAGPAEKTLGDFHAQSGVQVLFSSDAANGVRTNAVRGEYSPREALDLLLRGTPLVARRNDKTGAFIVSKAPGAPAPEEKNAPRPAPVTTRDRPPNREPAAENAAGEQVVELSPFTVTADEDNGYQATSTLSGTRLRTNLRDVAASVSVVTKDFMRDINATDLESLLVFTLGTEVDGLGGNFSNSVLDANGFQNFDLAVRSPVPGSRVRGLSKADTTLDFFATVLPIDSYNVERIEVSRGPNAMLFGLGSPAGIVNASLLRANPAQTRTEVSNQFGSFGTTRTSLDHNQVLRRDRLALRVAGLYSDRYYEQETKYARDARAFATLTARLTRSTSLRVSGERGESNANKPRINPPFDSFSWWWKIGQPVYDPTRGVMTFLGTPPTDPNISPVNASGGKNGRIIRTGFSTNWNQNVGAIFENPASSQLGLSGHPGNVQAMKATWDRYRLAGNSLVTDALSTLENSANYLNNLHRSEITFNFWRAQQVSDPAIFDFYNQTIDGPDNWLRSRWKTYNLALEQTFLNKTLGVEVAYDRQDMSWAFENPFQSTSYTLFLDINSRLVDGTPNPNFGRPVVTDVGWTESNTADRKAARATAYYHLDFARLTPRPRLGSLLGRHVFTAAYTDQSLLTETYGGRENITGLDYIRSEQSTTPGIANTAAEGRRNVTRVIYLGPSVLQQAGPQNTGLRGSSANHTLTGITELNTLYYRSPAAGATAPSTPVVQPFSVLSAPAEDRRAIAIVANRSRIKTQSSSFVTQSHLLRDTLVATLGWRKDRFQAFDSGQPPFDPVTGHRVINETTMSLKPVNSGRRTSFSWGLVAHAPGFVESRLPWGLRPSVFYNEADNFTPTSQRYDVLDRPIPANTGTTREYGAMVSLPSGKIDFRLTRYETASLYSTNAGLRNVVNNLAAIPATMINHLAAGAYDAPPLAAAKRSLAEWVASPSASALFSTFRYAFQPNGTVGSTDQRANIVVGPSDFTSKGWEAELVCNPTRNWRISANLSRAEAIQDNTGTALREYIEKEFLPLIGSPAGALSTTGISGGETLEARVRRQLFVPLYRVVLQDGSPNAELREWRWNVVTNYRFPATALKGWSIGGSVRWQGKVAVGFPVINDTTGLVGGPVYDVQHPFYGPSETNYGAQLGYERKLRHNIRWSARLTLKNIGVREKLIPVGAQPDGSIAAYRIAEPMTWTLSNTFSF